jgi:endonuclease YncB( thermonuclease family)
MPTLVSLVLLLLATVAVAQPIEPPLVSNEIEVTDGDTIDARGHTYRLVGCDAPEFSSRQRKVTLREKRLARPDRSPLRMPRKQN